MPSRWWVPLRGLLTPEVSVTHVHAAFSRWFDQSGPEHHFGDKPYAISPMSEHRGQPGLEIATLTEQAEERLHSHAQRGAKVKLGRLAAYVGTLSLVQRDTWADLATHNGATQWRLEFVTPVTFRSGDRSSPAPHAATILEGLRRVWQAWSDTPLPEPAGAHAHGWISDLDLRSEILTFPVSSRTRRRPTTVTVSAATGQIVIRPTQPDAAPAVGALLRLAAYSGVGSMTRKGLGVTRVSALACVPSPYAAPAASPSIPRSAVLSTALSSPPPAPSPSPIVAPSAPPLDSEHAHDGAAR